MDTSVFVLRDPIPVGVAWDWPSGSHLASPADFIGHVGPEPSAEGPAETVRVLIVAGDPLARAGLAAVLAGLPEFEVAGQAAPDAGLAQTVERWDPDVILWDAGLATAEPDPAALDEDGPPVLMLCSEPPPTRGAAVYGLVSRNVDASILAAALRAVARGLVVLERGLEPRALLGDRVPAALLGTLTPREVEVLHWLAAGLPNKLIAERLGISEHTVRFHLNAIFGKLDAHTRTEAVARAARLGIVVL